MEDLKKLFDGTTAPPWELCQNKAGNCTIRQVGSSGYLSPWIASARDAALIVAAVNALPELLARLERYDDALKRAEEIAALIDYVEFYTAENAIRDLQNIRFIARAALKETGQ